MGRAKLTVVRFIANKKVVATQRTMLRCSVDTIRKNQTHITNGKSNLKKLNLCEKRSSYGLFMP